MSFAEICRISYTIDYLSEGGSQSHSLNLTCVDRDSYHCVCCFVFIKPILGNRYGPGVIP